MRRQDIVWNQHAFHTLYPSDHDWQNVFDEINSFHTSHNRCIKSTELNSSELNATTVRLMKQPWLERNEEIREGVVWRSNSWTKVDCTPWSYVEQGQGYDSSQVSQRVSRVDHIWYSGETSESLWSLRIEKQPAWDYVSRTPDEEMVEVGIRFSSGSTCSHTKAFSQATWANHRH